MENKEIKGKVHSIQSLGTVDGPGVRFVAFLSGCPLRCSCCHNPDTWDMNGGTLYTAEEIVNKAKKYREYFGSNGGITLSGGEPLCQAEFSTEIFRLCKDIGINTCLDTSGIRLDEEVKLLLKHCDRVLLDIKYTCDEDYKKNVGTSIYPVLKFLDYLNKQNIPTTIRQVIIPTVNDNAENLNKLKEIIKAHPCVDGVELLPFRKICQVKYDQIGIEFPFSDIAEADASSVRKMETDLLISLKD